MPDQEDGEQVNLSPEFTEAAIIDALHDSPTRLSTAPMCFPGTSLSGKRQIANWLEAKSRRNAQNTIRGCNIFWVHGPAGVGKTTLMQTLAETLLPSRTPSDSPPSYEMDVLSTSGIEYGGAAFFFSEKDQITDPQGFFITLAYGLGRRLPPLAPFIQSAFDAVPEVVNMPFDLQCEILILNPIAALAEAEDGDLDIDLVMIVDALDECCDEEAQLEIIATIRSQFSENISGVRWLWIFSSRTHPRLASVFTSDPTDSEAIISLADGKEMTTYLESAFAQMRASHPVFQSLQSVESDANPSSEPSSPQNEEWPSRTELISVQWHAAGLYASAASILELIASPSSDPRERLASIDDLIGSNDQSHLGVGVDHPYSKLDALYHTILAKVPADLFFMTKRILGAISCTQPSSHKLSAPTARELAELLDITVVELLEGLHELHSLVRAPFFALDLEVRASVNGETVTFYHQSFDLFLRTPARSLEWALDLEVIHLDLAICCLNKLSTRSGPAGKHPRQKWFIHCWRTGMGTEAALTLWPELYGLDYTMLHSDTVDRYFVEWLLHLQEKAPPGPQLINPGPQVELSIIDAPNTETPINGQNLPSTSSSSQLKTTTLPERMTYILGSEPAKQVYLVPVYDIKVRRREDLGKVIGPKEKHWDWVRGFQVLRCGFVKRNSFGMTAVVISPRKAEVGGTDDADEINGVKETNQAGRKNEAGNTNEGGAMDEAGEINREKGGDEAEGLNEAGRSDEKQKFRMGEGPNTLADKAGDGEQERKSLQALEECSSDGGQRSDAIAKREMADVAEDERRGDAEESGGLEYA